MKTYEIHFICHGMTKENLKGAYIGRMNIPLSTEGIKKLKEYDEKYKYPGTPLVYTSPLLRCIQTCNILYPCIKPTVIDGLKECSFGEWEGKTAAELRCDPVFVQWLANSQETCPPKGESGAEFTKRICITFEKIVNDLVKSGETTAVVVTHGGIIMTLLSIYGLPHAKTFDWQMDNGFGYSVRVNPFLWMRDKVVEVYGKVPMEKPLD